MAPYPESESMAIKRIKVALKKRNWDLFEQGTHRAAQMSESGYKWSNADQWQDLMSHAESEYVPPELWEKFSSMTRNILRNIDNKPESPTLPAYQEEYEEIETLSNADITIFLNQSVESVYTAAIKKHKVTINNIMYNSNKYEPEPKWFDDISRLINNLDKPNNELVGFLSLLSLCKKPGTVITSCYDANIVKNFVKSNLDFSIPDIKIATNPENTWKLYPLGGSICFYVCANCGYRSIKTDFASKTIVGSCSRCASPTYPDLTDINGDKPEVNPKVWYRSLGRLIGSSVWILINPPSFNEQPMIRDLIMDAAQQTKAEKIFIVSHRNEVANWWKVKLEKFLPNTEIKCKYAAIPALLEDFKETAQKEETQETAEENQEISSIEPINNIEPETTPEQENPQQDEPIQGEQLQLLEPPTEHYY